MGATAAVAALVVSSVSSWRDEDRLNAMMSEAPQRARPLRVPSVEQLRAAFPGDARRVLETSEKLTLLLVDPSEGDYDAPTGSGFYDHRVVGQAVVESSAKPELLASFYDGLVPPGGSQNGLKQIAFCFNPRHGIRAVLDGKTVDLMICFECRHFEVYENGKLVRERSLAIDAAILQQRPHPGPCSFKPELNRCKYLRLSQSWRTMTSSTAANSAMNLAASCISSLGRARCSMQISSPPRVRSSSECASTRHSSSS